MKVKLKWDTRKKKTQTHMIYSYILTYISSIIIVIFVLLNQQTNIFLNNCRLFFTLHFCIFHDSITLYLKEMLKHNPTVRVLCTVFWCCCTAIHWTFCYIERSLASELSGKNTFPTNRFEHVWNHIIMIVVYILPLALTVFTILSQYKRQI